MISFLKTLRRDLKRPSDDDRHISARKTAFTLLALLLGLGVATSMAMSGSALMSIAYYSLITSISFFASTFLLFTNVRHTLWQWVDDLIINRPKAVTIPNPNPALLKSKDKEYAKSLDILNRAKTDPSISIKEIKEELKKIFAFRSFTSLNITQEKFDKRYKLFEKDYKHFQTSIASESDWKIIENLVTLKKLAIEAVIISDQLLALLEKDILRDKKEINTANVAEKLTSDKKIYRSKFLSATLIDLYHFARGVAVWKHSPRKSARPTEHLPEFYQEGSKQNEIRKIYNTFIKHGFYLRYGNKAFRNQLNNYGEMGEMYSVWTQKDSKKRRKFSAYPPYSRPS